LATKSRVLGKRVRFLILNALSANRVDRSKLRLNPEVMSDLEKEVF